MSCFESLHFKFGVVFQSFYLYVSMCLELSGYFDLVRFLVGMFVLSYSRLWVSVCFYLLFSFVGRC